MIALPSYWNDPYVNKTQDLLYGTGTDLLAGKPSDYFAPIGEIGGKTFEDMLGLGVRDITQSAAEDAARRGSRGGGSVVPRAVADYTKQMRFADLQRALEGRKFFMNTGNEMISGVRSAGLTEESNKNSFNLDTTRMAINQEQFAQQQAAQKKAARDAMYGKLLSSAIGIGLAPFTGGASMGLIPGSMNFSNPFSTASSVSSDYGAVSSLPAGGFATKDFYNF